MSNFCFKFSIEGLVSFSRIILCIFTNCTTRYSGMPSFGVDEVLQSFVQCAPYFVSLSPMPRPYLVPLPPAYSTCILHLHTPSAPTTARPCLSGTALASEWLTQRYIRRQTTPPKYRRSHKPACNKACAVLGALFSGRPLGSSTRGRCTP